MYDKNIQDALSKLDRSTQKRNPKRIVGFVALGFAIAMTIAGGTWFYSQSVPVVSEENLSRLIIVASRSSDNDPIRLLVDVERHVGKKIQHFSNKERVNAMGYLMSHIELNYNKQELISY